MSFLTTACAFLAGVCLANAGWVADPEQRSFLWVVCAIFVVLTWASTQDATSTAEADEEEEDD